MQTLGANGTSLHLSGAGVFTSAILSPALNTTINFSNDNTVVGTITGSGAGVVNLAEGRLHADAAGAVLNFPAGLFNWSGSGTLSGPGVFTNTGTIQIVSGSPKLMTELVDAGTILHGDSYLDLDGAAAKLRVVSGGVYETRNGGSGYQIRAFNNPAGVFVEAGGVFRHNSATGAFFELGVDLPFSNLGTVAVAKGQINLTGLLAQRGGTLSAATLPAGTWEVANAATLNLGFTGLASNAGNIVARGSGNFVGLGALASNSASLSLLEGADLTTTGANFTNTGDAMALRSTIGTFDVVLMANLIDRLRAPQRCLARLSELVKPGGQLVITSPYTWLEEFTPRGNWLGGIAGPTLDGLKAALAKDFELTGTRDLPFLIREHARKFQLSVAQASLWKRR